MASKIKSQIGIARIATVIVGLVVLGVGLHSHFYSLWRGYEDVDRGKIIKPYEQCTERMTGKCPSILMERYYVAIIMICFILSVTGLAASFQIDLSTEPYRLLDLWYHVIAAILLLIGAIVYLVSAEQIHALYETDKPILDSNLRLQRGGKIAAASLTILESLIYGYSAILIARGGGISINRIRK